MGILASEGLDRAEPDRLELSEHEPTGESRQDANYDYHWTDGQGNVQSSNDPFFNPNQDHNLHGNQNWTLMTPKSP